MPRACAGVPSVRLLTGMFAVAVYISVVLTVFFLASKQSLPQESSSHATAHPSNSSFCAARAISETLSIISQDSRMVNSEQNKVIRLFIADQLSALQAYGTERGHTVDLMIEDDSNIIINTAYWQSTNLALRIRGTTFASEAGASLLISTHFDSAPHAPGATDSGVAVAVMVEAIRNLLSDPKALESSLIFLFNNGEELDKLGSQSFTHHPWFANVSAFINLDSAGAAERGARSMLFRSNSADMVRAYAAGAPYPHASVLAQNAMDYIRSDTDGSIYSLLGGKAGIDIGFYNARYLYHSQLDDLAHVSADSVQQMGENLLGTIKVAAAGDVGKMRLDGDSRGFATTELVYGEIQGMGMFVISATKYRIAMIVFIVSVIGSASVATMYHVRRLGWRRMIAYAALPFLDEAIVVLICCISPPAIVYLLSLLKTRVNPASTYGHPILNVAWIAVAALTTMVMIHTVATKIRLARRLQRKILHPDVVSARTLENVDNHGSRTQELNPLPKQIPSVVEPEDDTQPKNSCTLAEQHRLSTKRNLATYAVCLFQSILVVLALALSVTGIQSAFILFESAIWPIVAILVNGGLRLACRRWEVRISSSRPMYAAACFAARWSWFLALIIGTTIPILRAGDLLRLTIIALPAVIAEGLNESMLDLAYGLQITLSLIILHPYIYLLTHRHRIIALTGLSLTWAVLYGLAATRFPFSVERPARAWFTEMWDVTSEASAQRSSFVVGPDGLLSAQQLRIVLESQGIQKLSCDSIGCLKVDADIPVIRDPAAANVVLPWNATLIVTHQPAIISNSTITIRGKLIGPPSSSVCVVSLPTFRRSSGAYSLDINFPSNSTNSWIGAPDDLEPFNGFIGRSLHSRNRRVESDFSLIYNEPGGRFPNVTVRFECIVDETAVSSAWKLVEDAIPKWMGWYSNPYVEPQHGVASSYNGALRVRRNLRSSEFEITPQQGNPTLDPVGNI
ncbi:hypothetical protein HDU85_006412 [Gaertneriomyces sp. JEL0708]|nr:hypothetical protein HDU85_006412 [Gaertneriomyces sp. JEL0708]